MEQKLINLLRRKILRYYKTEDDELKSFLKNSIYLKMKPYMIKWLSSILSKKGMFLSKEEMISMSWDCFEFCLRNYKYENEEIYIPNHFYTYTNFYIKTSKIRVYDSTENDLVNVAEEIHHEQIYEHLEELKEFRKGLPEKYKIVFDDALMSLIPNIRERLHRAKETELSTSKYKESKKLFKIVIDFLIRRGI